MDEEQAEDDAEEEADEVDEDHVDQVEYSAYPQVPVSDMLTPSADAHNHGAQARPPGRTSSRHLVWPCPYPKSRLSLNSSIALEQASSCRRGPCTTRPRWNRPSTRQRYRLATTART